VRYRRKKFTFAISSPDEFLLRYASGQTDRETNKQTDNCKDTLIAMLGPPTAKAMQLLDIS